MLFDNHIGGGSVVICMVMYFLMFFMLLEAWGDDPEVTAERVLLTILAELNIFCMLVAFDPLGNSFQNFGSLRIIVGG